MQKVLDILTEPFCDFPFDNDASRANAIATMLSPVIHPMIAGTVPLAIVDKPQLGGEANFQYFAERPEINRICFIFTSVSSLSLYLPGPQLSV